ncbi:MAG: aldo/keto reductase, partial [Actinobacteria bacterium]|nr:aldo/keto reductase [Actinomycetota bacterium]
LNDETLAAIAARLDRTVAQVILRWHLQLGNVVIPKSVTPTRVRENFDLFDFELSDDDMAAIARLDVGHRIGPDPTTFSAP